MKTLRLAVLISGTGRSLQNLIKCVEAGTLAAKIELVVSSSDAAKGLQFAEREMIPIRVIDRTDFQTQAEFSKVVFDACRAAKVDYIVMAGYLRKLDIPTDFQNLNPQIIDYSITEKANFNMVFGVFLQQNQFILQYNESQFQHSQIQEIADNIKGFMANIIYGNISSTNYLIRFDGPISNGGFNTRNISINAGTGIVTTANIGAATPNGFYNITIHSILFSGRIPCGGTHCGTAIFSKRWRSRPLSI